MIKDERMSLLKPPPAGYRFMLAAEAERMTTGDPITLWNGDKLQGLVWGHTDEAMTVKLRSGAIVTLDLDSPDYWPDSRTGDRRPPMDASEGLVAIKETMATEDDEIEPLLKVGNAVAKMAKDDPELAAALAEVRRIFLNRLRGKAA
jgi:hypothetical protein